MKRLSDLEAAEVSLVERGANKRKFLIFKNQKGKLMDKELLEQIKKADPKAMKAVEKVLKEYSEKMEEEGKEAMDERTQAALKAAARILTPFKEKIGGELMGKILEAAGMEMEGEKPEVEIEMGDDLEKEEHEKAQASQSPSPVLVESIKALEEGIKKLGEQIYPDGKIKLKSEEEMEKADETEKMEDAVSKSLISKGGSLDLRAVPKAVRPVVEAIYKSQQELVKKNNELSEKLANKEREAIRKSYEGQVAGFTHIADKEGLVDSLVTMTPDQAGQVLKSLGAANAQIEKGDLFKEVGSGLSAGTRTSWEAIEKAAEGFVAKSGEKVTKEEATARFLETKEGQAMYSDYKNEKGGV